MKRYGALIALVLAVGFGLMAVVLANKWLSARSSQIALPVQEEEKKMPVVRVVVAKRDLDIGTPLSAEHLTLIEWPRGSVPNGAFHDLTDLKDRTVTTKLWTGAPVLSSNLAPPGSGAGMVATIKPGMRAMAVRVDEVSGVGGFILPNTYVDVISVDSDRQKRSVNTLLKRIRVLAIAQETFTDDGKPKIVRTVTLELNPKDAEKLALQMHDGNIHLSLLNPLEELAPEPPPVIVQRPAPVRTVRQPAPPPPTFNVEVIRRSDRQSLNFKGEQGDKL
jgi:pilus assembly protein CpaB